ncbi:hypothetical protein [Roseomonas sp. KE0001]|uniref:hypothetical protein n=1 Tax=Roseomonas sp. KE0001 TaxID=2479201 RepID=UPI0018DF571E|nr:hypothetical protein [Roseomonas sp. KE0001]
MRWSDRCRQAARLLRLLPAVLLLAACVDMRPYAGNPGGAAPRLVLPPAYRIAVPPPQQALLTDAGAQAFARELAEALQANEVPAAATDPNPLDWPLTVTAERQGQAVRPRYELRDADGVSLGTAEGQAVPLRLWGGEAAAQFKAVAVADAPAVAELLGRVEAARKASDPAALAGKGPMRIRLAGVKGAPGDGNTSLNARMRDFLIKLGYLPQDGAEGATYAVQGDVKAVDVPGGQQRIELQWIVSRRDGHELGRVVQLNEVPRGTLNGLWGDVAYVVAEQAAGGIREVLQNAVLPPEEAPKPAAAAAAPPEPPPPAPRGRAG